MISMIGLSEQLNNEQPFPFPLYNHSVHCAYAYSITDSLIGIRCPNSYAYRYSNRSMIWFPSLSVFGITPITSVKCIPDCYRENNSKHNARPYKRWVGCPATPSASSSPMKDRCTKLKLMHSTRINQQIGLAPSPSNITCKRTLRTASLDYTHQKKDLPPPIITDMSEKWWPKNTFMWTLIS